MKLMQLGPEVRRCRVLAEARQARRISGLRQGALSPSGFRRLPLSDEMKQQLVELKLRSRYSGEEDPVFAARNGRPLGHRNVTRRGFEPAAEKAGLEDVTFHEMRHAFASRMISRGISSTVLAKLMGHESSAITEKVYVHFFDQVRTDDAVREAMDSASV